MRKRKMSALAAAVVVMGGWSAATQAFTIYQDNFGSQSSGTLLGGQAVQTETGLDGGSATATWNTPTTTGSPSDALWNYTGSNSVSILSPNGTGARDTNLISDAILPFTPQSGLIYTLQATITVPAAGTDNHWVGLSFVNGTNTTSALSNDGPTGLVIVRDGDASATTGYVDIFEAAAGGTGGDNNFNPSATALTGGTVGTTLTVTEILNTSGTAGSTLSWQLNGVSVGSPVTLSGNPAITGVAFGDDTAPSGTVSSFSLTDNGAPQIPHWNVNNSGDWNTAANWGGGIPNAQGAEADFFSAITGPQTVYTNQSETLGIVHFNNSNTYELSGTGNLQLQANGASAALIQVDSGTQIIDLPLTIASNTTMNVASGAKLVLGNPVTIDGGLNVAQTGSGSVVYQSIVNVQGGSTLTFSSATSGNTLNLNSASKAVIASNAGTVQFVNLNISSGSNLDLKNNSLIINYGPFADPISQIVSYLTDGYNTAWSSGEISSSSVATANQTQSKVIYGVGYADGADGVVAGLASGQIEIRPTLVGDAKLSGNVVFGDFQLLAANFGKSAGWDGGNFNYSTVVNFGDFQLLAQNFGATGSLTTGELTSLNGFAAQFGEAMVPNSDGSGFSLVAVPEPTSITLIGGLAGLGLLGRRHGRKSGKSLAVGKKAAITASVMVLGGLASVAHAQTTILSDTLSDQTGQTGPLAGSVADTVSSGQTWISYYSNNDAVITPATQVITASNTFTWATTPAAGTTAGYTGQPPFIPTRYDSNNNPDNNNGLTGTKLGAYDTHVDDGAYIGFNTVSSGIVTVDTTVNLTSNSVLDGTAWAAVGILNTEPASIATPPADIDSASTGSVGAWILIRPNLAGSGNGDYAELYATGGTGSPAGNLQFIPSSSNDGGGAFWGLTHDVQLVYDTTGGTLQAYVDGQAVLSTPYNYAAHGLAVPTADGVLIADRTNSPGSSGGNATGVSATDPANVYFSNLSADLSPAPPISQWQTNGSGNWNSIANWSEGIPNSVGEEADLFGVIGQQETIYTNTAITLSTLHVNNGNEYEITGTGSLTLQGPAGTAALLQVDQGSQVINLPLTLASNTNFVMNGNLTIANPLTVDAGTMLSISGGGSLAFDSTVTVQPGATINFGGGSPSISDIALGSGSKASFPSDVKAAATVGQLGLASGATLDVGDTTLTIDYGTGADPIKSVQGYLQSGHSTGAGIISSFVATHPAYGVGYADGADGVAAGLSAGEIEVLPALLGDATLSGSVTFGDFQILAAHFGQAGSWDQGDFLYDPTVSAADFAALASNLSSSSVTSAQLAAMDAFAGGIGEGLVPSSSGGFSVVAVPEPATAAILALGGATLMARRRRHGGQA